MNIAITLFHLAKSEFLKVNVLRSHPFGTAVLATNSTYPSVRTVVTREASNQFDFLFYTDSRANKVQEIQQDEKVSLIFYHEKLQLQVRIKGKAQVLTSGEAYEKHKSLLRENSKDYNTVTPPGVETHYPVQHGSQDYFALISIKTLELDILKIGNPHSRANATKNGQLWNCITISP